LTFSAQVYADGDLTRVTEHEESEEVKEWENVKVYDSLMIRHWDTWLYPGKRSQLFSVDLTRHGGSNGAHWSLADAIHKPHWSFASPFRNLLNGVKLESPVAPFGDTGDFAVSATHVAFTARDPDVSAAITTKHNIYIVPLDGSEPPKMINAGDHGASSSPNFSPKGNHLVWLQMYDNRYEADRNRITIAHVSTGTIATILPEWQLSPATIDFTRDGKSLVGTVENQAQKRLFTIELHRGGGEDGDKLTTVDKHEVAWQTEEGAVGSVLRTAHADEWLVSASTLRGPAEVCLVSKKIQDQSNLLQSHAVPLTNFGQSKSSSLFKVDFGAEAEHFAYPGANGRDAYAWLVKPPGYDENAKGQYPLAVLVHGGPEGAWVNSWSARWNQLVFAAQGFVVVAFNPAGSTGYGQAYQEEILGQLGGAPLQDIQLGTKYVLDNVSTLDRSRVVAAGASYGGYMMNWIQGHNEDKMYKGLVCHDGIFSIQGMYYATEELYFPEHEAGGPLYDPNVREKFLQWSPERFADKWETPMLVIHGGKDYRLTDSEGISAFTLLQRRGIDSRFLYFPKENHWVINQKNSLKWHEEVLGWLKKYS
ncbi:alpha/beta-hydrolase, partial [Meira miltonrushii]